MVQSSFQRLILRDKGVFNGKNFSISSDGVTWVPAYAIFITEQGKLFSADDNDNDYLLLQYLQSCYVQIIPDINSTPNQNRKSKKLKHQVPTSESPPVIFIKTFDNEKLYIKIPSKNNFGTFLSALIVWQNLKPKSLVKKWYCENKFLVPDFIHEVLVCRFKVYGPIINKGKSMNLVDGPKVPNYLKNLNPEHELALQNSTLNEGWFYTMGVLKSNGILNFVTELDGTLVYSIDIRDILSSEIREMHHSIFDNSNVLFLGQIKQLRWNNLIKGKLSSVNDQTYPPFIVKDGRVINSYNRVFIEFPLHIDLEDWFVGLNYFSKREYIGSYNPKTAINKSTSANDIIKKLEELSGEGKPQSESNLHDISFSIADTSIGSLGPRLQTSSTLPNMPPSVLPVASNSNNHLLLYEKEFFRISKRLSIDIIEAKFDDSLPSRGKIYAEVVMWGIPWSRTAIVNYTSNPFWKEEFTTDLPISTQMIHILIKKCSFNESNYLEGDKVIGTVYITPDILMRHLDQYSTLLIEGGLNGNTMKGGDHQGLNNDIVNVAIYDSANIPIGKLLVNVNLKEYHILAPKNFKPLEKMLHNAPMKDLIEFCNKNVSSSEFENVSLIMLDIFQSLGIEDKWFRELMDSELVNVDKISRQNYVNSKSNGNSSSSNNVFNTLFRGSSIFSKSLEKYNLRIGQEYLEKVFGDFFAIIDKEKKNCEVDPRYVRLQEKAERKGKSLDDSDLDDDSDLEDEGYDTDEEDQINKRVNLMIEENFSNLYNYAEMIWNKIYITSNDLPEQIKTQLKHFRTKVELACDPNDKVTALNCLSAFLFLRFFCPAILNPKLFYLTKNHQTGRSQRTLTLIAKILLNLANRQEFSPHKEPHLVKMNEFLAKHQDEVMDYFDRITGRRNDFHEKILELSHEVKRFDLGLSGDSVSGELPTTPYLIDKCLRLTEFIYMLDQNNEDLDGFNDDDDDDDDDEREEDEMENNTDDEIVGALEDTAISSDEIGHEETDEGQDRFDFNPSTPSKKFNRRAQVNGLGEGDIKFKNNMYQIGSLEFEKSEFLDLAGDNETESFIKSLVKSDEHIFSFITSNITVKDLQKASHSLKKKIQELEIYLSNYEYPSNYQSDQMMWDSFTQNILSSSYLDLGRNCLVQWDNYNGDIPIKYKKTIDNALGHLKLRFFDDSATNNFGISSEAKNTTKNPFKKWFSK